MKILVYPHLMEIGGSQLNAVQLAGAVRDLGHEVIVISEPGPLVGRVHDMGLEHIEIPLHRRRPSVRVIRQLAQLVRERHLDIVHGYEWPPVIEALYGPGLRYRTPIIGTVMSMSIVPFFPRAVPLIVGTVRIRDAAVAAGHSRVTLLEPPVDTESDNPAVNGSHFRGKYGIQPSEILVAMVCRLVPDLKLEGLLATCDAISDLARAGHPVRLAIVGDGSARHIVAERAGLVNRATGGQIVFLTGEITDPRSAYAAADVIVGQGGSALRGMAFGKPLIVVGEDGFSELVTPQSVTIFLRQGWYGLGGSSLGTGAPALRLALERLLTSSELRRELGSWSRRLVVSRFSLHKAAKLQEREYLEAVRHRLASDTLAKDLIRSTTGVLRSKLRRKYERWRGTASIDDSNARTVVSSVLAGVKNQSSINNTRSND
jgi:glycosyltransferase involved in cell wall biosynthesis